MMTDVKTLKQAVSPIIWLNCIFCMGIFELPINRPRYFLSIFYAISILIIYFFLLYEGICIFLEAFSSDFIIFQFVMGVNIMVAILAIILFWWKSENMTNIIKKTSMVDNTLKTLGLKPEYPKIFRNVLYLIIVWTVGMIIVGITNILWMYHETGYGSAFLCSICICFPIMINSIVGVTFASFIRCIQQKFQKINDLVDNIVLCVNKSNTIKIHNQHNNTSITFVMANYKSHKNKIMHLIQTLRILHLEITKIGQQINHAYCLQLLLEMAVHFTVVTATTYCLYRVFSGHLMIAGEKVLDMALWGCIYSVKIILVNCLCTSVSTEAYKTGEIIQSFEGSIIDDDMREEIRQFTQQVVLNSLNFTASGFFTIDNSLTGKFFATVTTYVVILIQMNVSAN
ncbi:putative gustatory receptor 28b [Monomorium pharaonis]|uniref:putative gustatory receptor 28b n=1 Tax=Monomorium pharaonis TaxID=307658 RepID=UPI00063F959F|nr:putative gustatory receptor 28b [Monomorium pharaonis]XP_036144523.1 putative gustatory receptor 28b [Monomorium pharaonis]XP_036144524.1 putative gustatory receptor 28b [Monomorium pharaonis]